MSDIGGIGRTPTNPAQGGQQATGVFAGLKVAVGEALSRVADAFRSFTTSVKEFFTSLFSMSVRQEPMDLPRVGRDAATQRLGVELSTMNQNHTVTDMVPVQGRGDVTVAWIFARDLHGSGRFTMDGKPIIDKEDSYGNDNHDDKIAAVVGALEQRFGVDCIRTLSQFAHQGSFGSLETVLGTADTPVETADGRKVFAQAENRTAKINFSQDPDGAVRITFAQELRSLQMLIPLSPGDTAPPPVPKEGATVRTSFDVVLRRDQSGEYQPHVGPLHVQSDLGV